MRAETLVLAAIIVAGPSVAQTAPSTDEADVTAAVTQYIDSNNKNDAKAANAACAAQAVVIDSIAPYVWQGASACRNWWNDVEAYDAKNGITDPTVTPDKRWMIDVSGDRAYVVVPVKYTYKQNGKLVTESAIWTFAEQKLPEGWRFTGLAWAQH